MTDNLNVIFMTGEQQSLTGRQCVEAVNDSAAKVTPAVHRPASTVERKQLDERASDGASETDCSDELIPQVLQGNKLTRMSKPASVDTQQVDSPSLTTKNLQNKKGSEKKEPAMVFTDSSLSDSDSDTSIIYKAIKGGDKATGDEPKSTPKKKVVKKAIPEQVGELLK